MRPFVILSFIFALLVATTFAPFATAAPLPRAAIEVRCPNMECRNALVPSDSSIAGDSSAMQTSSTQSTMVDLIDGLILVLSSMRQLAAAAAPSSPTSSDATSILSSAVPTSTPAVDLASIATFTPASPAPTSS